MTDEKKAEPTDTTPSPPPDAVATTEPPLTLWGAPLASYVKGGGTSTMANDRELAERHAAAEKRRDVAAAERRIASVPIEHGGGRIYANRLTENAAIPKAHIVLDYVDARGEPVYIRGVPLQCLADLISLSADELCLQIACPRCYARGKHLDDVQLQIRQQNKKWELDMRKGGELVRFEDGLYPQAGRILESEVFACPVCKWTARIVDNKVWPA